MKFKDEHGHTIVPQEYPPNPSLGQWVHMQRYWYKIRRLNDEQLKLLQDIGFVWDAQDDSWEFYYRLVLEYKAKYGNCHISESYWRNPSYVGKKTTRAV